MKNNDHLKTLIRGAMLLVIAVVAQQLRLFLPIPPPFSIFIIGTILNMIMVLAVRFANLTAAALVSFALPCVAFMQGHLALPFMIPIVFLGNFILVFACSKMRNSWVIIVAPVLKTVTLYILTSIALQMFGIGQKIVETILFTMGWPQFVTAVLGVGLATQLEKRLNIIK